MDDSEYNPVLSQGLPPKYTTAIELLHLIFILNWCWRDQYPYRKFSSLIGHMYTYLHTSICCTIHIRAATRPHEETDWSLPAGMGRKPLQGYCN